MFLVTLLHTNIQNDTHSYETQVGLVRNAWSDLFVLGMSQCAQSMNLQAILAAIVTHLQTSVAQEKLTAQRVRQVTTTICKVQEYVRAMTRMNIDDREFAFLKTIALFGTGAVWFAFLQYLIINISKVA